MGYEERVLKSSLSQRSFLTNRTKTSAHSRKNPNKDSKRVKSRPRKDESYTTMDGRVHHPKIWGARECTWKPHELESLTSLIDQAMKNTLANKNATVISADQHEYLTTSYTPTSIGAKSNKEYARNASNRNSK